jgi:LmbE family N-acetylglucosaminyl deacetylase
MTADQMIHPTTDFGTDTAAEIEVTARGLPAQRWRPLLSNTDELPDLGEPAVVVVVVPHPDDETLGAGGLLHRLRAVGTPVTVVFVTDGAAGYPGSGPDQAEELARIRRDEALAALATLDITADRAVFLDVPDGDVAGSAEVELAQRLGPLLAGHQADLCLAPWPLDPHPDHQAVGRAAVVATATAGVTQWQYPIWMRHSIQPDDPRVEVDRMRVLRLSAAERSAKRAAVATHTSQVRSPFPGFGPVLPDHVLDLFADGYEPFFVPADTTDESGSPA